MSVDFSVFKNLFYKLDEMENHIDEMQVKLNDGYTEFIQDDINCIRDNIIELKDIERDIYLMEINYSIKSQERKI